jgi:hypothetical protein
MNFTWINDTQWVVDNDELLSTEGLEITISSTPRDTVDYVGPALLPPSSISFTETEKRTVLKALDHYLTELDHDDDRRRLITDLENRIEILSVNRPDNEL